MTNQNKGPNLTFPAGEQVTNAIGEMKSLRGMQIFAPAAFAGDVFVSVSNDGGATWQDQQSAGTAVQLTAAEATPLTMLLFDRLRLRSSVVQGGAPVTFTTRILEDT